MNKLTSKRIQVTLGIVAVVFSGIVMISALQGKSKMLEKELVDQTFHVATPAGEAFEVKALHKCGEGNMRKAAIHATASQTGRLNPRRGTGTLEAITKDYARIYDGNIKPETRCEITGVSFTNITGKAYIVGEE
jgi:hypothetical protein